jgi:hypothetical protein
MVCYSLYPAHIDTSFFFHADEATLFIYGQSFINKFVMVVYKEKLW